MGLTIRKAVKILYVEVAAGSCWIWQRLNRTGLSGPLVEKHYTRLDSCSFSLPWASAVSNTPTGTRINYVPCPGRRIAIGYCSPSRCTRAWDHELQAPPRLDISTSPPNDEPHPKPCSQNIKEPSSAKLQPVLHIHYLSLVLGCNTRLHRPDTSVSARKSSTAYHLPRHSILFRGKFQYQWLSPRSQYQL